MDTIPRRDPFEDLPDHLRAELRSLLAPVAASGIALEFDPVLPQTVGVGIEGHIFRIAVVSDKQGAPQRVEILGPPGLSAWDRDTFLSLLPDASPAAAAPAPREPLPERRDERDLLADILTELREIRKCLPSFEP